MYGEVRVIRNHRAPKDPERRDFLLVLLATVAAAVLVALAFVQLLRHTAGEAPLRDDPAPRRTLQWIDPDGVDPVVEVPGGESSRARRSARPPRRPLPSGPTSVPPGAPSEASSPSPSALATAGLWATVCPPLMPTSTPAPRHRRSRPPTVFVEPDVSSSSASPSPST